MWQIMHGVKIVYIYSYAIIPPCINVKPTLTFCCELHYISTFQGQATQPLNIYVSARTYMLMGFSVSAYHGVKQLKKKTSKAAYLRFHSVTTYECKHACFRAFVLLH